MTLNPLKNVLGTPLRVCCRNPMTGFYRNGLCEHGKEDHGVHTVCVAITKDFLDFSQSVGNDLSTPHPEFGFQGLKPGDFWCLCASRWKEALDNGKAPLVDLEATHFKTLEFVGIEELLKYAYKKEK